MSDDKLQQITITIQKARDGRDYVQIMSGDVATVNIVLIADRITLKDDREKRDE